MTRNTARFIINQTIAVAVPLVSFRLATGTTVDSTYLLVFVLLCNVMGQCICRLVRPELSIRRMDQPGEVRRWDIIISALSILLLTIAYIVAGIFRRNNIASAENLRLPLMAIGAVVYLCGMFLATWAMISNPFYSTFVQIQSDRNHQVVQTGPYRWIRHPGYLAISLQYCALPLIFGTLHLYIIVGLLLFLLIVRTNKEDSLLSQQLVGYQEYRSQVKYKTVPFLF